MPEPKRPVSAYVAYQQQQQQQQQQQKEEKVAKQPEKLSKRQRKLTKKQQQQQQQQQQAAKRQAAKPEDSELSKKRKRRRRNGRQSAANGSRPSEKENAEENEEEEEELPPSKRQRQTSLSSSSSSYSVPDGVIDPVKEAAEVFKELIAPVTCETFFADYFEKKPLLLQRSEARDCYDEWFSTDDFDSILRQRRVMFGEHLDVTSYRDGQRETHNPDGRALASQVWEFYKQGCSLRLMCPQLFHERVYQKLSILQEQFGSFVGANVYLTPPNTQGFAPHWDDIEAFIMQLEGCKHWRVYRPRSQAERLPRLPSRNFGPRDQLGQPIIDTVLRPGDLMYLPRGYIHQGRCHGDEHSLHITVSTYQKFAWVDLLEKALGDALEKAAESDVEFRRGLPLGILAHAGTGGCDSGKRQQAEQHCRSLLSRLAAHLDLDAAVDAVACQQVQDALPPALDPSEESRSVYEAGSRWLGGPVPGSVRLLPRSRVRLLRRSAVRLCNGRLHFSLDNTRVFREVDPVYLEVDADAASAVEALLVAYPAFTAVSQLPLPTEQDKLELANCLFDRGLLVVEDIES